MNVLNKNFRLYDAYKMMKEKALIFAPVIDEEYFANDIVYLLSIQRILLLMERQVE